MKNFILYFITLCSLTLNNVKSTLNCVAYEPFSDPNYPSNLKQALKDTLSFVANQGFKCIKTYHAQYYGLKIADAAREHNLKVVLGIKMGESFTENEIQAAIHACKQNPNVIAIYAGNENPNSVKAILSIKNRVKSSGCRVPFGTVQTIDSFLNNQNVIGMVNQMDWLGYNVYPFFSKLGSGESSAQTSLRNQIKQMRDKYGYRFVKFRIAETGWPSQGGNSPQGNPSTLVKAKRYADFFARMLCSNEFETPWVSYFTFFDPIYKKNVKSFEHNFGLVKYTKNGYRSKWNIKNLHC